MLITDFNCDEKCNMVYCSASVNENYVVLMADDYFYNFVGKTVGISFTDLLDPNALDEFNVAFRKAQKGHPSRMITKAKGSSWDYQLVDILIKNENHQYNGVRVWDIEINNIYSIEKKHIPLMDDAYKYRAYLSLRKDLMFDYDFEFDRVTIYQYNSSKPTILYRCNLMELHDLVVAALDSGHKIREFENMLEKLKSTNENFRCEFWMPNFEKDNKVVRYSFQGMITYKHNRSKVAIGIGKPMEEDISNSIPFYDTTEGRDPFTGLYNKRACEEYVIDSIALNDAKHYLCIIDIDNFKTINDTYGHMYGDEVILKVASAINSCVSGRGIAGRFGGDEFFIFTNHISDEAHIRSLLTAIRQKIVDIFSNEEKQLHVTLSIGASLYPNDGKNYKDLFNTADKCLYLAKHKGKNRYIIYVKDRHGELFKENGVTSTYSMDLVTQTEYLSESVADIGISLAKYGKDAITEIFDKVRNDFNVDGIRIYKSGQAAPIFIRGQYVKVPQMDDYVVKDILLQHLTQNKYLLLNSLVNIEGEDKDFFDRHDTCNIQSIFVASYFDANGVRLYFCYDCIGRGVRRTESEKNNLLTISKMLTEIL